MKQFLTLLVTIGMLDHNSFGAQPPAVKEKELPIAVSDVYVPDLQSSRDNAYVVVSGLFRNGCYRWSRAIVRDRSDYEHEVTSYAFVHPGECIMMLIPYTQKVELGQLKSGRHLLRFQNGDDTFMERQMNIQ